MRNYNNINLVFTRIVTWGIQPYYNPKLCDIGYACKWLKLLAMFRETILRFLTLSIEINFPVRSHKQQICFLKRSEYLPRNCCKGIRGGTCLCSETFFLVQGTLSRVTTRKRFGQFQSNLARCWKNL